MADSNSLIVQLQQAATEPDVPVSVLLRKALVAARKLKLTDFAQWINDELKGYADREAREEIPEHRWVTGSVVALNGYSQQWCPFIAPNLTAKTQEILHNRTVVQPVSEIEDLVASEDGRLFMPYNPEMQALLLKADTDNVFAYVGLDVDKTQMRGILDAVRNKVLDWALRLEDDGIVGEGLTFTKEERDTAAGKGDTYNFFNIAASNIGSVGTHHINQGASVEDVLAVVTALRVDADKLELQDEERHELEAELDTAEAQAKSPKPRWPVVWVALSSVLRILEATSAALAVTHSDKILKLFGL